MEQTRQVLGGIVRPAFDALKRAVDARPAYPRPLDVEQRVAKSLDRGLPTDSSTKAVKTAPERGAGNPREEGSLCGTGSEFFRDTGAFTMAETEGQEFDAAHAAWREVLAGFDTPTLVGLPGRAGQRGVASFRLSPETTRALGELAGCYQTSVSTVVQAAFAQLLMSLSGQPDVAFGATVSGDGATDIAGAESTVGLSANTMPVRATITATTTTTDLLDQLQHFHHYTTPHQHLGLSEIHCVTGHDRLFDTLFVWENNPNDTGAVAADRELQ